MSELLKLQARTGMPSVRVMTLARSQPHWAALNLRRQAAAYDACAGPPLPVCTCLHYVVCFLGFHLDTASFGFSLLHRTSYARQAAAAYSAPLACAQV